MVEELIDVLDENGVKTGKIYQEMKFISKDYGIGQLL